MPTQQVETVSRKLSTELDAPTLRIAHGVDDGEFQFAALQRNGKTNYMARNELVAFVETVFLTVPSIRDEFAEMFASERSSELDAHWPREITDQE